MNWYGIEFEVIILDYEDANLEGRVSLNFEMTNSATASRSLRFEAALKTCPTDFFETLKAVGFTAPLVWASFTAHAPGSDEALNAFYGMARELGAGDRLDAWAVAAADLHELACKEEDQLATALGAVDSLRLSADLAEHERNRWHSGETKAARVVAATALAQLPSEWRGKRYRRLAHKSENARAEAEEKDRLRWSRELAGLLLEAKLPFSRALGGQAVDTQTPLRCCKGLRAGTISQRISCWRPFRRWLLAQGLGPWPSTAAPLLEFFELRKAEGAPRTAFNSLLQALAFLEEAGEVDPEARLCLDPSLSNAAKEAALHAANRATKPPKGAAPALPLKLVEALEQTVVNDQAPAFARGYAWFRLLKHWGALRWDDTQGLPPHTLERTARGVAGTLSRTKTSGPGKHMGVLPVFVSEAAWVSCPWLDTGYALWTGEGPLASKRDYLLPLPTTDLQGITPRRALYSDCSCFSQALWRSLSDKDGLALLPEDAGKHWTEHSERAGLDSWAAALGISKTERSFLGRWSARGSVDVYVRTAMRVVENVQLHVARFARKALAGGPDYFGEEYLLATFRKQLEEKGWSSEGAQNLEERLRTATYTKEVRPPTWNKGWTLQEPAPPPGTPPGTPTEAASEDEAGDDHEELVQNEHAASETALLEQTLVAVAPEDGEEPPPTWGFVVSITRHGKHRKLHHIGSCKLQPGTDYKDWEHFGETLPDEAKIDSKCKWCFKTKAATETQELEEASITDGVSSSSSSGEESPAKMPRVTA